ncbi:hypothetical protein [Shimia sp. MIT1388]|uniref:hypothetical protein n=1 Tax=Shimia sp. MIT1388 TaxID=3096992 RepID=UPI00399A81F3
MAELNFRPILHKALEYAPSAAFLATFLLSDDLRIAGWSGAACAFLTCFGYARRAVSPHSLFLGINLYLLMITPVIEGLYAANFATLASTLSAFARPLVFLSIFLTGSVLSMRAPSGFLLVLQVDDGAVKRTNALLLIASGMAAVWALVYNHNTALQLAVPMTLLFALHRTLKSRSRQQLTEPRPAPQGTPPK